MFRVCALALPRVVAFDLAIPAQVFGHAEERDRFAFTVCTPEPGPVPSTTGYAIQVDLGVEALGAADLVVIPGYAPHGPPPPAVIDALQEAAGRGARVISVCTGAFALAAAGLLDGRQATTHWHDADELARRYPAVDVNPDALYIDSGQVMTSAGVAAGIDLCLHVVRNDLGIEHAVRIARRMVVAPHREGGQAQFLHRPLPTVDSPSLTATCSWALQHLAEPITIDRLAQHAGWSPRSFARRFVAETGITPRRWLTAHRLLEARRLLESTTLSIEDVAARSGLGTAANLRLHFTRDTATSPTEYRHLYRGRSDDN